MTLDETVDYLAEDSDLERSDHVEGRSVGRGASRLIQFISEGPFVESTDT